MATALQSALKMNPSELVDTVRESTLRIVETAVETAQTTFAQKQKEGRLALSKQVLKGAQRVNDLSKALVILSAKIAPAPKARAAAKPAARKPAAARTAKRVAVRTAKPRARKAA